MIPVTPPAGSAPRTSVLPALGERIRRIRLRRGMTRKACAAAAGVSERHFANLELGTGNASILVLHQVADALQCPMAELVGDPTTESSEWLLIREILGGRSEAELRRARLRLAELFGTGTDPRTRRRKLALTGLRGAGKSSLGQRIAARLECPFVELSREIEGVAGCSLEAIHSLYGTHGYRRYERRALQEVLERHDAMVLATPGGIVSDPATYNLLLEQCVTIWLQARPEEHMARVVAQGDLRPMAGHAEAMDDLRRILDSRSALYAKADITFDTSGLLLEEAFAGLVRAIDEGVDPRD